MSNININDFWACSVCDLMTRKVPLTHHQQAKCPQCGHTLSHKIDYSIEKTLALSLTSLIFFLPAILLPLMTLNLLGIEQQQSIFNTLLAVYEDKQLVMAFIIFMACIILPFMKMSSLFYVSLALYKQLSLPKLGLFFRIYHVIEEWSMLEIFLLAIIVSIIKLRVYADLSFNVGLIFFILLLLMTLLSSNTLDKNDYWNQIGKLGHG